MYQQIYRMTAGRNDNVPVLLRQNAVVFPFDQRSSQGGFLRVIEAQLFKRFPHGLNADALIVGYKGGGQRSYHRAAALNEHLSLFGLVHDLLGVLGADHKAVAAKDTFVADDVRLITGEAYGFHRIMADTFIAVFAVGFFQRQAV